MPFDSFQKEIKYELDILKCGMQLEIIFTCILVLGASYGTRKNRYSPNLFVGTKVANLS